jgi:hypothetical protein
MAEGENKRKGRYFYKDKGLHGLVFRIPKETKTALRILAEKMNKPLYGAVQSILTHYLANQDLYDIEADSNGSAPVEVTVFIDPKIHKRMKLKGIHATRALKDLSGGIIHEYMTKHCQVNLGDEDGN